jgi:hypothetical protein
MKKFLNILFISAIIFTAVFISFKNYQALTWLSGWDNLHPEFNLSLNIKRSLSAVWQEYQGLGLVGGMGHASDLPRQLILLIFSLFLPTNILRYIWMSLMLLIGPLGVYFFAKNIILGRQKSSSTINLASFTGALFYLFNLATLQYFFTPYESFITFFGYFPWLVYLALNYIKSSSRKNILIFFVVSFLASASFYVQTLFIVYITILAVFLLETLFKEKKKAWLKIKNLILVIFATNAFWLLPFFYFTATNSDFVSGSKINSIATPETWLMNTEFGDFKNIALIKGFWFDYMDLDNSGEYDFLLIDWKNYLKQPFVTEVGYLLFALGMLGLLLSVSRKNLWRYSWIIGFFVSFVMLATVNPPFGFIFSFFQKVIPLFTEALRSPFTKWSVIFSFFIALGLSFFIKKVAEIMGKLKIFAVSVSALVIFGSIFILKPLFQGKLVSDNLQLSYPQSYFEVFEYFKSQPQQARIAFFPVQTFWGWNFYSWGYRGSGFLWYGIKQPVLDRAFDVWSPYNENFYQEISTAVYANDEELFRKVIDKYDISYALIDENIISPEGSNELLKLGQIKGLLDTLGAEQKFDKGGLKVYDLSLLNQENTFVYDPKSVIYASGDLGSIRKDPIFDTYSNYITRTKDNAYLSYPFADLTKEFIEDISYQEGDVHDLIIKRNPLLRENAQLTIPGLTKGLKIPIAVKIGLKADKLILNFEKILKIELGDQTIVLDEFPKVEITTDVKLNNAALVVEGKKYYISQDQEKRAVFNLTVGEPVNMSLIDTDNFRKLDLSSEFYSQSIDECWVREGSDGSVETFRFDDVLKIKTKDAAGCMSFKLEELEKVSSLINIRLPYKSENLSRPHFCVLKEGEQVNCENEEVFYDTKPSEDWTYVERDVYIDQGTNYWLAIAARPADEKGKEWAISYLPPQVLVYDEVQRIIIKDSIWNNLYQDKKVRIDKDVNEIKLHLSLKPEFLDLSGTGIEVTNCDIFKRGDINKFIVDGSLVYEAKEAASICDYKSLRNISTQESYFLRIKGEGIFGRGVKFYLFNEESKRNDLEVLLPTDMFDKTLSILSWPKLVDNSYTLRLETRSFGSPSKNRIDDLIIYKYPIDWIFGIKVENPGKEFASIIENEVKPVPNDLEITSLDKTGTYKYDLKVKGSGVLALSQGYDKGWIALTNFQFPFTDFQILPHVKVNSWANGWIVGDNQCPKSNDQSKIVSCKLKIVFWPQYLEFLGFGILISFLLIISLKNRFQLTKKHKNL